MALPDKPKDKNFMDHMAPNALSGTQIVSIQQEFHEIRRKRRHEDVFNQSTRGIHDCWSEDMKVESAMRKRLERGGATFTPNDILDRG